MYTVCCYSHKVKAAASQHPVFLIRFPLLFSVRDKVRTFTYLLSVVVVGFLDECNHSRSTTLRTKYLDSLSLLGAGHVNVLFLYSVTYGNLHAPVIQAVSISSLVSWFSFFLM